MYTIDPVKEAHEAVQEALHELVNKGTEHNWNRVRTFVGAAPNPVYPPLVRSTVQASSLYKPGNVTRSVNYFQTVDEEGLKVGPRFGIQGSPMMGADKNTQLGASDGLGTAGHGEITYNSKVLTGFEDELTTLKNSVTTSPSK